MSLCRKTKPWIIFFVSALLFCNFSYAQIKAAQDASKSDGLSEVDNLQVSGKTLDNKDFQLSSLKGKVTLVVFWSTNCAVCRVQMPELRENIKGWADKPFELVLVSVDKNMKDVDDYYGYLNQIIPLKQRFTQLWTGSASYKDNISVQQMPVKQLPASYLIDKNGKNVAIYSGRIPAQVWDEIADLL